MAKVCRLFGIEKLRTTPYKPSTNQVKRFHRTIKSWQRPSQRTSVTGTFGYHMSWLPSAQLATIRPNFLVLGRKTRAPPDLVYGSPEEENDGNYDGFVKQMHEKLVTIYSKVINYYFYLF